ncbi:MAG TPA: RNA polymerase sigma factor [Polyangiaceae bacterium]
METLALEGLTASAKVGGSVAFRAAAAFMSDDDRKKARAKVDPEIRALHAIMERLAKGQDSAYAELYKKAAPRVHAFLLRLSGDRALADDLVQDTFIRIGAARGAFEEGAAAWPWMIAIARNTFLDAMRRTKVRRDAAAQTKAEQAAEPVVAPPEARGDEALAAREMLSVVQKTLDAMPELSREAFILVRFEGLSMSEAADVLGTTEAAVKIRAFRAYALLREALGIEKGGAS